MHVPPRSGSSRPNLPEFIGCSPDSRRPHVGARAQAASVEHTKPEELAMTAPCRTARQFWSQHREASLNWLALGLLLAAWNASDDDPKVPSSLPNFSKGHKTVNEL
jgi:hypothetical protein